MKELTLCAGTTLHLTCAQNKLPQNRIACHPVINLHQPSHKGNSHSSTSGKPVIHTVELLFGDAYDNSSATHVLQPAHYPKDTAQPRPRDCGGQYNRPWTFSHVNWEKDLAWKKTTIVLCCNVRRAYRIHGSSRIFHRNSMMC